MILIIGIMRVKSTIMNSNYNRNDVNAIREILISGRFHVTYNTILISLLETAVIGNVFNNYCLFCLIG